MMDSDTNKTTNSRGTPWGMWATVGWGLLVAAVFTVLQGLVLAGFVASEVASNPAADIYAAARGLGGNGFVMALATFVTTPLCISLIVLLARLRRGPTIARYLGLKAIALRTMLFWLGIVTLFALLAELLAHLLGRSFMPDFMVDAYTTAYFAPLFWIALVVAAPLFEEVFFRGFLFEGLLHSKRGPLGAVFLTSLAWTILHVQYGAYELGTIFALGVIFGVARLKTQSIYPPLAMHSLFNLFAMAQLVAYLGRA
jgi:membrane protease YdiL (CAAX protease family)